MKKLLFFITLAICASTLFAQPIFNENGKRFPHHLTQEEIDWARSRGYDTIRIAATPPPTGQIRPIAEWEPAEAVLISYADYTYGPGLGIPYSLIKEMAKDIVVITIVPDVFTQNSVLNQYINQGIDTSNCKFLVKPVNSYWTRDFGPWFMAIDNHDVGMFDFKYNRPRPSDDTINKNLALYLSSYGKWIERYAASELKLTGGNYMNDGIKQGASSTITITENPGKPLETLFQQYLGIEQYHFIEDPVSTAPGYLQHIDCWAKFLAPDKVLVDSVGSGSYFNKFENVANYFRTQTSSYGTPMRVYRVFAPGAPSSNPKTPYSNSLILNNKVFVPIGGNQYDAAALQVYEQAMPGYTIIPVTQLAAQPWLNTDALHCRTHEIADRCMLYIKHQPLYADMLNTGSVNFNAEIYSYCQKQIIADSVRVFVKANGETHFTAYTMDYTGDNKWEVAVCGLPSGKVEYYVIAAEETGKRESHPYINSWSPGKDPHKFMLTGEPPHLPVAGINKTESSATSDGHEIVEDFITIYNFGDAPLTFNITDIVFDEMLTIEPVTGSVPACGSQIITFSYDFNTIAKAKEYLGSCILSNNDPYNPEIEITLSAILNTSEEPVLWLEKISSAVTSTGLEIIEDHITISNMGDADLTFEIKDINFNTWLEIYPLSGNISSTESKVITLSYNFADVANGEYFGSFNLSSNDPLHPETEITLYAYQNYNGVSDSKMSLIYIYPNPATQVINIYFNENNPVTAFVYDILGKQQKEIILNHGLNFVDIKELPNGIYFIRIGKNVFKFVK